MKYGFLRVALASPSLKVADTLYNTKEIISVLKEADKKDVRLLVFPELTITGYTCQDLFLQDSILKASVKALEEIADESKNLDLMAIVGLPFEKDSCLYNTAAFIYQGQVLALIPKSYIPNYGEFYEQRWFTPYQENNVDFTAISPTLGEVPFGTNIILEDENDPHIKIACEICEDAWVPLSPASIHSLNGATIIANLSASNEIVGKADYRKSLISSLSAKSINAYLYANASHDESSQDLIFSGHSLICQNGQILAEKEPFENEKALLIHDIDLQLIEAERIKTKSFAANATKFKKNNYTRVFFSFEENKLDFLKDDGLIYEIQKHPFVPSQNTERAKRCHAVIEMQAEGLAKRLRHINGKSAVIGLSGGLDSTLALLVTSLAFDKCGIPRENILSVTMPCFGTTERTYKNALCLAKEIGSTLKEVNIKKAVLQHFEDIGQDQNIHDVTYENSQARERTQVLMDLANKNNGLVIGTGDLSELALGWCTYNGDHMSMYAVNSSIPKSLVRHLVSYFCDEAKANGKNELHDVLDDILKTPVSPELIPPEDGKISQKTEEIVGPYELHDFILYYVLRRGFSPEKIYYLACKAFLGEKAEGSESIYTKEIIFKWLKSFYKRFFSQQFKRSCMPDGAKVGSVNLSPRGDWRMPSDASVALYMKELDDLERKICGSQK